MKKRWPLAMGLFTIPLIIVTILHLFGENRFDVQLYHDLPSEQLKACGVMNYPYSVDTEYAAYDSISMIFLSMEPLPEDQKLQMLRIGNRFNNQPIKAVLISTEKDTVTGFDLVNMDQIALSQIAECQLFIEFGTNTVLLDGDKHIRGYYNSLKREDIDRLAVEAEILLKNGEDQSKKKDNIY